MYNGLVFTNIRFYVLLFSACLAAAIYFQTASTVSDSANQLTLLSQYYALIAIIYLYIALMATPLTTFIPNFPYRVQYIKARRALGVSAFLFSLTHATIAFFFQLGGFASLPFLEGKYLLAISLSATALFILFLMASTSFDFMVAKLTYRRWKYLHRLVYLAAIFLFIHPLLIGSHFQDLSGLIPKIFLVASTVLLALELIRFATYLKSRLN